MSKNVRQTVSELPPTEELFNEWYNILHSPILPEHKATGQPGNTSQTVPLLPEGTRSPPHTIPMEMDLKATASAPFTSAPNHTSLAANKAHRTAAATSSRQPKALLPTQEIPSQHDDQPSTEEIERRKAHLTRRKALRKRQLRNKIMSWDNGKQVDDNDDLSFSFSNGLEYETESDGGLTFRDPVVPTPYVTRENARGQSHAVTGRGAVQEGESEVSLPTYQGKGKGEARIDRPSNPPKKQTFETKPTAPPTKKTEIYHSPQSATPPRPPHAPKHPQIIHKVCKATTHTSLPIPVPVPVGNRWTYLPPPTNPRIDPALLVAIRRGYPLSAKERRELGEVILPHLSKLAPRGSEAVQKVERLRRKLNKSGRVNVPVPGPPEMEKAGRKKMEVEVQIPYERAWPLRLKGLVEVGRREERAVVREQRPLVFKSARKPGASRPSAVTTRPTAIPPQLRVPAAQAITPVRLELSPIVVRYAIIPTLPEVGAVVTAKARSGSGVRKTKTRSRTKINTKSKRIRRTSLQLVLEAAGPNYRLSERLRPH